MAVVALTDGEWRQLMGAIGRENLLDDRRFVNFVTRVRNAEAGLEVIREWVAARDVDEVVATLRKARVPCGRVATLEEVNADEHLRRRGMLTRCEHPRLGELDVPGPVIRDGPVASVRPHPDLGQHSDEVLREWLSLSDDEIAELRSDGVL